ncbi:hypothetical protein B0H12DRAFT_1069650 [Mycena haematopus]|nr:hypothetical protein B0H12DRAFT_1069650 [Mycena haematopus]
MADHWADSALFIEDRNNNGIVPSVFHDRRLKSRWAGDIPTPTFVYGLYATIGDPHPVFKGFGELTDYPGDGVPDNVASSGTTTSAAPPTMTAQVATTGYSTPESITSSDSRDRAPHFGRDNSRTWESPTYQADVMRHRAMTPDRERARDDNRWTHRDTGSPGYFRRPENNYKNDRRDHSERPRFHNYALMSDDHQRARDTAADRNRGTQRRRSRSPHNRERRATAPRLIDNPDIAAMPRGPDAHPQSRWAVAQNSGHPPAGDVVCPSPDPSYVSRETARVAHAMSRPFNPRRDGHTPGSNETYAFFKNVINTCAFAPTEFRSEGESYLVSGQQAIEDAYWDITTGPRHAAHTAPNVHEVDDGALTHRPYIGHGYASDRAPESAGHNGHGPSTSTSFHSNRPSTAHRGSFNPPRPVETPRPQPFLRIPKVVSAADRPAPPPIPRATTPSDDFADNGPSYLGTSAPNPGDQAPVLDAAGRPPRDGRPNTKWTIGQVLFTLTRRNPNEWARGIRSFMMQQPPAVGESPYINDAVAYYTFCALAPINGQTPAMNHQYRLFFKVGVGLFSIRGLFAHIVRLGAYERAALPMNHYPYPTDNITIFLVAGWFVQHGIDPDTSATGILEEFARARRNMQNSIDDLENEIWMDELRPETTLSMSRDHIPQWTQLVHAPLNALPTLPTGLTASIHAPMEDVTATHAATPLVVVVGAVDALPSPPPGSP